MLVFTRRLALDEGERVASIQAAPDRVFASPPSSEMKKLAVVEEITQIEPRGRRTRIVAVDGFGGCGKSEFAERLARKLAEATIVHTDDFSRADVPGWEWDRLREQVLEPLAHDRPGRYQRYDWGHNAPAEWHDVPVGGNLIVEGVSSMREELGTYWD